MERIIRIECTDKEPERVMELVERTCDQLQEQLAELDLDPAISSEPTERKEPPGLAGKEEAVVVLQWDSLDGQGQWVAQAVGRPGTISQGPTIPSALRNLADAYQAVSEVMEERAHGGL